VLWDGVPLNDPFGGWAYWTRIPAEAVERVEVLQGGGSDIYGDDALGGVVNVFRRPLRDSADIDIEGGNRHSVAGSVAAGKQFGNNALSGFVAQNVSDGYILVPAAQRGSVDTPANGRSLTGDLRWERDIDRGNLFLAGNGFGERRHNGSPLQSNDTSLFQILGGAEKELGGGTLLARVDGSGQSYNQSFSAIAADRNSETLSRLQHVPAQQLGARAAWLRLFGSHSLSFGGDVRSIRGVTEETIFVGGTPSSLTHAGGRQLFGGGFIQDTWRVLPRLAVTIGGRIDAWRNYDARSVTLPLSGSSPATQLIFPDRSSTAFDPRLSAVFHPRESISLFATGYRSFRAPRLNELYRAFRLGNVLTLANANLQAERLTGVDAGIGGEWKRAAMRTTFFFGRVEDPVANVTLTTTPALITRQRQNAGRLESRGLQLTGTWAISSALRVRGDYQFADSQIVAFGPNPQLVGKQTPQVPRHSFATSLLFDRGPWAASLQGRVSGNQFDDDLNQFALGGASSFDAYLARRWGSHFQTYFAAENILDSEDLIGRTPVPTVGLPFTFRGGIRILLGRDVKP
jgi:outer membrane receptor protein involved in Fe transport